MRKGRDCGAPRPSPVKGRGRLAVFILAAFLATPATAQTIVTSPGPTSVSVTIYRAPHRGADEAIDRDDPEGFALVTETRTVSLPAGPAVIRFEGVAGNILPESAIVADLPSGVREKNLDADLLSPRTLYDRALGRRVILRRTDPATGKVTEQQATIRSSAAGAAVLQVAGGYEALRCSGLPETIVQTSIPDGLSARPTLSIATESPRATTATITLSYLAGGFDWQADYVVTMRPDGHSADLFAWVTLASSDITSFANAGAQVVAGKPNRVDTPEFGDFNAGSLSLRCWLTTPNYGSTPPLPPPPPPPPPAPMVMREAKDIVVTGARARKAIQEDLGDLKLYRIPDRTTVASKAQKQVALLEKAAVPLRTIYVSEIFRGNVDDVHPVLRARNRSIDGLGLPLPAGQVAVFRDAGGRQILIGQSSTDDKAIGEDVEFKLDPTPQVDAAIDDAPTDKGIDRYVLTITNANPWPIAYEAEIDGGDQRFTADRRLTTKDGRQLWAVTVPANGTATLGYTLRDP